MLHLKFDIKSCIWRQKQQEKHCFVLMETCCINIGNIQIMLTVARLLFYCKLLSEKIIFLYILCHINLCLLPVYDSSLSVDATNTL